MKIVSGIFGPFATVPYFYIDHVIFFVDDFRGLVKPCMDYVVT
jgi:hypothetical protein